MYLDHVQAKYSPQPSKAPNTLIFYLRVLFLFKNCNPLCPVGAAHGAMQWNMGSLPM